MGDALRALREQKAARALILLRLHALPRMTSESAIDLRKVFHGMTSTVGSLEGIGRPISNGTDLFVHLVVELLDSTTRREWEQSIRGQTEPATYEELRKFIEQKLHMLEALPSGKLDSHHAKRDNSGRVARALHAKFTEKERRSCPLCSRNHFILFCEKYKARTAKERQSTIDRFNLCQNCLGKHALTSCKSDKVCSRCQERHHTTLHDAYTNAESDALVSCATARAKPLTVEESHAVLLATARVSVKDIYGNVHEARALLDLGSETSLVAENLVQRLRLPRTAATVNIVGAGGGRVAKARSRTSLSISSRWGEPVMEVSALILPRLTSYGEKLHVSRRSWPHLANLELADPRYSEEGPVDILLGAETFSAVLQEGLKKGRPGEPLALQSALGWLIAGMSGVSGQPQSITSLQCSADEELSVAVRRFWEQEEVPLCSGLPMTLTEQRCLDLFATTHTRRADGRYVVRLPLKTPLPDLSDTRRSALRMLKRTEERFKSDRDYRDLYTRFMVEYVALGHMTPAVTLSAEEKSAASYLPHHGVRREASTSTKLRVVFNGSQKTRMGTSLNDCLLVGPNLLPRLADVLLRWRRHRYVFLADVEKMYRQILVHEDDRNWQRILWRKDETISEFRLNTVTYGLACAPFLAIRVMRQLADDERDNFPLGAAVLREDVYVDDILSGSSTLSNAMEMRRQLEAICMAGGFPLRKWAANAEAMLTDVPTEHWAIQSAHTWRSAEGHTALGLEWRPSDDTFAYVLRSLENTTPTKRIVLSQASQLFDPLGWVAPVTIKAKCIIQSTWLKQLGWDDPLPEDDAATWRALRSELPLLKSVRIPRWNGVDAAMERSEIHGFADASQLAYAAVLYLKTTAANSVRITLLCAKTRVALLKQLSLPRLELCAASLLVAVTSHTLEQLRVPIAAVHLWTDSTVTLGWIQGHPGRWSTFVANRVSEIQRVLSNARWHHVPGKDNPADCASRGLNPGELIAHELWWRGPGFLTSEEWPPATTVSEPHELPEMRRTVLVAERTLEESDILTRQSTLSRLLRVTAWMRRWCRSARRSPSSGTPVLTPEELREAENLWIRQIQAVHYSAELRALKDERPLSGRSTLQRLSPFKGEDGLLRVGGRLKHAVLSYDERHPVILPPESHLTELVIDAHHRKSLHGGVQLTLSIMRRRYWLPRGRRIVRQHIHRCPSCIRWRAASPQPMMGGLPRARTAPCRPFLRTGVDYAGPILLRTTKGRGQKAFKAFISIFICLSSRAVHIEVVSDYSTAAFIAAFRRFTGRRGACCEVYSDCGTTFVGADAELRAMFRAATPTAREIAEKVSSVGTRWRFNPPGAPHFGGLWEAAVKSVKHHLRRVVGTSTLTYEEMSTLLIQIEACLNSRPLQAMSDDPDDLTALTPGHFLIGEPLCALPEATLEKEPPGRLSRWQLLQQMRDHLWSRWSQEYLTSLAPRSKWNKAAPPLKVGQLCLLRSEITPPSKWPLARITELHPGDDGETRVVSVRTAASKFTRPVVKIVPLPAAEE